MRKGVADQKGLGETGTLTLTDWLLSSSGILPRYVCIKLHLHDGVTDVAVACC